jgi:molybdate transport system substrate-binding protein
MSLVVLSTISCKEALIELVPEYEHGHGSSRKIEVTYTGGRGLTEEIRGGRSADLFIGPEEFSNPLIAEGKLAGASRTAFARSSTGLCVRAGGPRPDISTPEKLKSALLAAHAVSYSKGASGIHFVKALEKLGIAGAVAAKLVPPDRGELIGEVVARGAADIGAQQFSELLPVSGIDILGPLPPELQQTIVYGATAFPQSKEREAAQDFVKFLCSEPARKVLQKKGLEPA